MSHYSAEGGLLYASAATGKESCFAALAVASDGTAFAAWYGFRSSGFFSMGIYGRLVDADGALTSGELMLAGQEAGDPVGMYGGPTVVRTADGYRVGWPFGSGVYSRVVASDAGSMAGTQRLDDGDDASAFPGLVRLKPLEDERLLATWVVGHPQASNTYQARLLSSAGEPLEVLEAPAWGSLEPLALSRDRFAVFGWTAPYPDAVPVVTVYDLDGEVLVRERPLAAALQTIRSAAAETHAGGFLWAWTSGPDQDHVYVTMQAFGQDGAALAPSRLVQPEPVFWSSAVGLNANAAGDSIVVFGNKARYFEAPLDFGDAPAPYPTSRADDGARHAAGGLRLGTAVDVEDDPAVEDGAAWSADEEGVAFEPPLLRGGSTPVRVTASQAGRLDAWIDLDGDGSWAEPGDKVFDSVLLDAGVNELTLELPAGTSAVPTWSRFRFSESGGLEPIGPAGSGEVEDHPLTLLPYSIAASSVTVDESASKAVLAVTLTAADTISLDVPWSTAAVTAGAADFVPASGTLHFAEGQTTASIEIGLTADALDEVDETFGVTLEPSCTACVASSATITITDDDAPPALSIGDVTVVERHRNWTASVPVTLAAASGKTVKVRYQMLEGTAGAGDYVSAEGVVTMAAGQASVTVPVTIRGDRRREGTERFTVRLRAPSNATLADASATVTITDDDR